MGHPVLCVILELRLEWVGHLSGTGSRCDFELRLEWGAAGLANHNDTLGEDVGVGLNLCSNV
jgi:hypothetical protein